MEDTKTLYVGNIPWSTTEEELSQAFSNYARVIRCRIITDRETGRSRGFGFVEVDAANAAKALQALNGYELGGRQLVVNEARPKTGR